jgi:hypothetical protein
MGVVYFREGSHPHDPRRANKEQILFLDVGAALRAMENCTRSSVRSLLFNRLVCALLCPLICEMTHSTRTFSNRR